MVRFDERPIVIKVGPPPPPPPRDVLPLAGAVASAVLILAVIVRGKK